MDMVGPEAHNYAVTSGFKPTCGDVGPSKEVVQLSDCGVQGGREALEAVPGVVYHPCSGSEDRCAGGSDVIA